jgi:pantoate--beta-alanine ligase
LTAPPTIIRDPIEMAAWSETARRQGHRIAFVPTMGALHEGHVSLLREGRRRGQRLVLSIFVNPTQFGPTEDLARYPRDLDGDLALAATAGTDVAYVPEAAAVYPPGFQTFVEVREVEKGLCGERRPGHFVGVATVVCKLFNVVRPQVALFGEKDFQQLAVIRRMVRDLDLSVDIVGMPVAQPLSVAGRAAARAVAVARTPPGGLGSAGGRKGRRRAGGAGRGRAERSGRQRRLR